MQNLINGMNNPPQEPTKPTSKKKDMDAWEALRYEKKLDQSLKETAIYEKDKSKVLVVVKGLCTLAMKNKLASLSNYKALEDKDDVIGLLKKIKDLAFTTESVQYEYWTLL